MSELNKQNDIENLFTSNLKKGAMEHKVKLDEQLEKDKRNNESTDQNHHLKGDKKLFRSLLPFTNLLRYLLKC
jgi:hypothetical protein